MFLYILTQNKEYWLKRGFTEEESKQKVKERQTTFSKEICIKKYGKEKDIERWKQRQEKWMNNFPKQNYSMVSQKLFWKIYSQIMNKFNKIYFATIEDGEKVNVGNKEFRLKTKKTVRSLDFYIPEINKCIEFDGTYWHGEEGRGNKMRDLLRDIEINDLDIQILHVNENPEKVINECMEFLNG